MHRCPVPGHDYPVPLLYLPARNDIGILWRHPIPGFYLGQHAKSKICNLQGTHTSCIAELDPRYPRQHWGNRLGTGSKTQHSLLLCPVSQSCVQRTGSEYLSRHADSQRGSALCVAGAVDAQYLWKAGGLEGKCVWMGLGIHVKAVRTDSEVAKF